APSGVTCAVAERAKPTNTPPSSINLHSSQRSHDDEREQDDDKESDRGGIAGLELPKTLIISVNRDGLRHGTGAALGQRPDDVEQPEKVEPADQYCDHQDRPDGRQHDTPEDHPV